MNRKKLTILNCVNFIFIITINPMFEDIYIIKFYPVIVSFSDIVRLVIFCVFCNHFHKAKHLQLLNKQKIKTLVKN